MRKKLEVKKAEAMKNGIVIYSNRHRGYGAISTVDEFGSIKTKWTKVRRYKKENNKSEIVYTLISLILISIAGGIFFNVIDEWVRDYILEMRVKLISFACISLCTFMTYSYILRKKYKNLFKFHAAEHMVLNAYVELQRVPSIDEIRKYPRFCNDCGTNATCGISMCSILMFFCTFIPNQMYMYIAMLFVGVIVFILWQRGFLNFLQKYTTIPPTDEELLVAIAGMEVWLENEKKKKEKFKILKFLHCFLQKFL